MPRTITTGSLSASAYSQLTTDTSFGNRPLQIVASATGLRIVVDRGSTPTYASETEYFLITATGNVINLVADPSRIWVGGMTGTCSCMVVV